MQSLGIEYRNVWGIYRIINTKNDKFYIGSSVNLYKRSYEHIRLLNLGKHPNLILQRSYNKSSEYYKIEILEVVNKDIGRKELLKIEQNYLDKYKTYNTNFGYNFSPYATGVNFTDEIRKTLSKSLKGKTAHNKNIPMSNQQKMQLKALKQSKVFNILIYNIFGDKLFLFPCIHSCVRALNIDRRSIQRCLKGEYSMFKGFVFRYENDPFNKFPLNKTQLYKYTAHYYSNIIVKSDELLESYIDKTNTPISSQALDHSNEGSETTGEKMGSLNNQN